jgi:hypothetical protein
MTAKLKLSKMQVIGRVSMRTSEEPVTRAAVRAMKSVSTGPSDTG